MATARATATRKVTCAVIRKKKGKYVDPKGPGPKKDPVKTIALVVLPQQRPFHKYLSEELRVIFTQYFDEYCTVDVCHRS